MFDDEKLKRRRNKPRAVPGKRHIVQPAMARKSRGEWIGEPAMMPGANIAQERSEKRVSRRKRENVRNVLSRRPGPMTIRDVVLQAESEAHFQTRVMRAAHVLGWWLVYHTWDSRRSPSGFPDLVLINEKQRRHIFVELKTERGRLTVAQERWRDGLLGVGVEWYLWRPSQWDELIGVLRGKAA
jgi:hypothetical protein